MPSNHLILCCPLLLPPSIFPSIRVFSNESALCIRWPKYWSFSFNISPFSEHPGLISSRMDWLYLLAVQETLQESSPTPQFKNINPLVLSFLYCPTLTSIHDYWETIALTRWTIVGKVISLLFNMLSRLVITFLPRSKRLLISWLQSPSAVILEPKKIKSATVSTVSPSICHEAMGPDAMILVFWIFSLGFLNFKLFQNHLEDLLDKTAGPYLHVFSFSRSGCSLRMCISEFMWMLIQAPHQKKQNTLSYILYNSFLKLKKKSKIITHRYTRSFINIEHMMNHYLNHY